MKKKNLPEWAPVNAGKEFASEIIPRLDLIETTSIEKQRVEPYSQETKRKMKTNLSISELKNGILECNKTILAQAITLIESNAEKHFDKAQLLLTEILPFTGNSVRIGISGMPGAGKSTFIESFGLFLIKNKKKPAILAIDPSSTLSKGSILGDKTRMEELSKEKNSFIRPSPTAGNLGGVARKTKETVLLCEAAGYDVILIETVGVGQNEVTVRSMVDFFLLILISGAGDELQGIKKGVIELADAILINKADGNNIKLAEATANLYNNSLHYLTDATLGWKTKANICSALEKTGIDNIWNEINDFITHTKKNNIFHERRTIQNKQWFSNMLNEEILYQFYKSDKVKANIEKIINEILSNQITPAVGVKKLLNME